MNSLASQAMQACRWSALLALLIGYALLSHQSTIASVPTLLGALLAVAPMLALLFLIAWRSARRHYLLALWLAACALLYSLRGVLMTHYNWVFLLEHSGTYAVLCASFGLTLRRGQTPMISRFAVIVHGELTPGQTRYTRSLTWVWAFYFGSISSLSLLLFGFASVKVWSTFAYLLGMPLLLLMFAAEYAVRLWRLSPAECTGPLQSIRAYRQAGQKTASPPHSP
ncbi:hypothetical protein AwPolaro_10170 [Polaromonas sp.]|nr:hypothetical protein AwPolaro_10170 [Polaromonas sp.]